MPLTIRPIEDVPAPQRRLLEHVERILHGHDAGLVATIALTILTRAIIALVPSRDLAEIDAAIDEFAVSLKAEARVQMERDSKKGFR